MPSNRTALLVLLLCATTIQQTLQTLLRTTFIRDLFKKALSHVTETLDGVSECILRATQYQSKMGNALMISRPAAPPCYATSLTVLQIQHDSIGNNNHSELQSRCKPNRRLSHGYLCNQRCLLGSQHPSFPISLEIIVDKAYHDGERL